MDQGFGPPQPPPPPPPPDQPPGSGPPMPGPPAPGPGSIPPRGLGEIYSTAFDLYKTHWQAFLTIVAVVIVPLTIIKDFVVYNLINKTVTQTTTTVNGQVVLQVNTTSAWRSIFAGLLLAALSFAFTYILLGAITRAAAGSFVGEDPTVEGMYQFGIARFWGILLVSVLAGLAILGGLILLIIPGIIIAVYLVVSVPAFVVENVRGRKALSRSWNLVKGRWWPVLGIVIVTAILTGIVSGILQAPFGSGWFGRAIGESIASIITMPFTTLVYVLIYLDLRARKEGLDLSRLQQDLQASAA